MIRSKFIVIFFITFLLGSCLTKTDEDKITKDEMDKLLEESMNDFKNRPIFSKLSTKNIDTTSDEKLLQLIFDNLNTKLPENYEKKYETVMSWNESRQAIYIVWWLDAEVNNGGYNQYYFNPSGQFYKHAPKMLRLIKAYKYADLTEKANKINDSISKNEAAAESLEEFSESYENNPLNEIDREFYKLSNEENLNQLQIDFIRKNKDDFIDK